MSEYNHSTSDDITTTDTDVSTITDSSSGGSETTINMSDLTAAPTEDDTVTDSPSDESDAAIHLSDLTEAPTEESTCAGSNTQQPQITDEQIEAFSLYENAQNDGLSELREEVLSDPNLTDEQRKFAREFFQQEEIRTNDTTSDDDNPKVKVLKP